MVTVQIFKGPALRPRKEATLRHDILESCSYNSLAQHRMGSFLFFKITPPYCVAWALFRVSQMDHMLQYFMFSKTLKSH